MQVGVGSLYHNTRQSSMCREGLLLRVFDCFGHLEVAVGRLWHRTVIHEKGSDPRARQVSPT